MERDIIKNDYLDHECFSPDCSALFLEILTFTFTIVWPCSLFLFLLDISGFLQTNNISPLIVKLHFSQKNYNTFLYFHDVSTYFSWDLGKCANSSSNSGKESPHGDMCQAPRGDAWPPALPIASHAATSWTSWLTSPP